ncbi:MAG: DUF1772 domain-containing protein [Gemmatimonadota bacterium]
MPRSFAKVLLWLYVLNLGIAFGAGLYESRIVIPDWLAMSEGGYRWNAEAAREDNTGLRFWVYVTTVPLTVITFANLVGAWRARGSSSVWWTVAALTALVERLLTFLYFIPTMIELMGDGTIPGVEAEAMAQQWVNFNYLRHGLTLIAWLAALRAFALIHRSNRSLS